MKEPFKIRIPEDASILTLAKAAKALERLKQPQQVRRKPEVKERRAVKRAIKRPSSDQGFDILLNAIFWIFIVPRFIANTIGVWVFEAYSWISKYVNVFDVLYYAFILLVILIIFSILFSIGKFIYNLWAAIRQEIEKNRRKRAKRLAKEPTQKEVDNRIRRLEEELKRTWELLEKLKAGNSAKV